MSKIENGTTHFLKNRSVWNSLSEEAYDILVGSCPQSGDSKTKDCKKIEGIEDNTVGFCLFWEKA